MIVTDPTEEVISPNLALSETNPSGEQLAGVGLVPTICVRKFICMYLVICGKM